MNAASIEGGDIPEREAERRAVVAWIEERMLNDAPPSLVAKSTLRAFLWAIYHPFKFAEERGRFYALEDMQDAIERGDHVGDER